MCGGPQKEHPHRPAATGGRHQRRRELGNNAAAISTATPTASDSHRIAAVEVWDVVPEVAVWVCGSALFQKDPLVLNEFEAIFI